MFLWLWSPAAIVAVSMLGVIAITAMAMLYRTRMRMLALKHEENLTRIKHGYPLLDEKGQEVLPLESGKPKDIGYIDMTRSGDNPRSN